MARTNKEKFLEIVANKFPKAVYPVLYPGYWIENLVDEYKIENNKDKSSIISDIFRVYYGLQFDPLTLNIDYTYTRQPADQVFIIRYLSGDNDWYIWEYFDNWMKIKNLNTIKI